MNYCKKIAVLLSTFNGELYLDEQIQSLFNQQDVNITIFVRDDGSKDGTLAILNQYKNAIKILPFDGLNLGSTTSFLYLLHFAFNQNKFDYFAFCDQDDIWLPKNLKLKTQMFTNMDIPQLAFAKQEYFQDKSGNYPSNYNEETFKAKYPFFQNPIRGCTMVINKKLALLLLNLDPSKLVKHDYAAYLIAEIYGNVFYIDEITMRYRIHANNESGVGNFFHKLNFILSKHSLDPLLNQATHLIGCNGPGRVPNILLSNLNPIANHNANFLKRLKFVVESQKFRSNYLESLILKLKILSNYY